MQQYLITEKLATQDIKFLFKLRTNMLDFKVNFKNKYDKNDQLLCPMCSNHIDNEESLLQCSELINNSDVKYIDIFSTDMNVVTKAASQFKKLWKMRKRNLN